MASKQNLMRTWILNAGKSVSKAKQPPSQTRKSPSKLQISQKAGTAAEKASKFYVNNAAETSASKTPNLKSILDLVIEKSRQANDTYADFAKTGVIPTKQNKTVGPQQWEPKTNTSGVVPMKFKPEDINARSKNLNPSRVWAQTSMELPPEPSSPKAGTGAMDRLYNLLSSIGDGLTGADKAFKSAAVQSYKNEAESNRYIKNHDDDINRLILERDRYSPASGEYQKYSAMLNGLYDNAGSIRSRPADMSQSNRFLASSGLLEDMGVRGLSAPAAAFLRAAKSLGEDAALSAMTGFNPMASAALNSMQTAGRTANEVSNSGHSAQDSLGRGVVSGAVDVVADGLADKIGSETLSKIASLNDKKLLSGIFKQVVTDGSSAELAAAMNYAADLMSGDRRKPDWDALADEVIQRTIKGQIKGLEKIFGF